ncbi:hypothetical protein FBU30_005616 [Linnemannia zychae]|nr:hypothetical protein FBU30_005616 [Linnemannia zychae]
MAHNTDTSVHNPNVSPDKPSAIETIKEKATAVINKITGKHHTDSSHEHDQHHHTIPVKDQHHPDNTTHTGATGAHTSAIGTHTGGIGDHTGAVNVHTGTTDTHTGATGTHTGTTDTHTSATGTHTGAKGVHTGTTGDHTGDTGAHTSTVGSQTGATGVTPGAAPTAVHFTGASITSGGNVAPPSATHASHHDTHGTYGTTGLAGATTQPLNHQHSPAHAHGGIATTTDATAGGITPPEAAQQKQAFGNNADVDPASAVATVEDVTSRLVGKPGDPNNLDPAHTKPTM